MGCWAGSRYLGACRYYDQSPIRSQGLAIAQSCCEMHTIYLYIYIYIYVYIIVYMYVYVCKHMYTHTCVIYIYVYMAVSDLLPCPKPALFHHSQIHLSQASRTGDTTDMSVVGHIRHVCCVTLQTCLLCEAAGHVCCVTRQTYLLCDTGNTSGMCDAVSAAWHSRHVCCATQQTWLLSHTADMHAV